MFDNETVLNEVRVRKGNEHLTSICEIYRLMISNDDDENLGGVGYCDFWRTVDKVHISQF